MPRLVSVELEIGEPSGSLFFLMYYGKPLAVYNIHSNPLTILLSELTLTVIPRNTQQPFSIRFFAT